MDEFSPINSRKTKLKLYFCFTKVFSMKKIQMVDLMAQYEKIKPAIDEALHSVIDKTQFINGPEVGAFQSELASYLDVKHVIPCANGTDALQIAMMAVGLKPGDEVITPSFTYIATTEVIALLGLKPVFVEVDPLTFCIDPTAVEAAITSKTKAIVPVHLYGQAAHMEPLMALAEKHNLFVIEDNAQAIGCTYYFEKGGHAKTGTIGHVGCTSFFPSKNLGCFGDGGAIFTNDDALANTIRMVANHGQSKRYYHDLVGCNSRLDSIQAAILRVKLRQLDIYNEARKTLRTAYSKIDSAREVDPQNPALEHSQQILIDKYSAIIEAHLADSDLDEAREFLGDLTATGISSPAVDSLKQKFSLREEDSGESKKGVAVGVF